MVPLDFHKLLIVITFYHSKSPYVKKEYASDRKISITCCNGYKRRRTVVTTGGMVKSQGLCQFQQTIGLPIPNQEKVVPVTTDLVEK